MNSPSAFNSSNAPEAGARQRQLGPTTHAGSLGWPYSTGTSFHPRAGPAPLTGSFSAAKGDVRTGGSDAQLRRDGK